MRILFFTTAFPQPYEPSRNPDNLERCVALGRHHAVHVVSPFTWLRLGTHGNHHESHVRGVPVSRPMFFYPPGVLRGTHAWCMWQGIRRAASRTIAAFRPDAILSYWTYPDTEVATRFAKLAGVPCVSIVGGSDVLSIDPMAPGAAGHRVRRALRSVDAIAAVSDSIKDHISALGIAPHKIAVLPAAIDREVFFPAPRHEARRRLAMPVDAQILVWVGRMVAVKALDVLLDAVAQVTPGWPALRLYLVGDGPLRRSLEAKIAALGLAQHVVFTGRVAHGDLPDYYRAADVTLLPSEWEGMPNTLIESHACGTPFVASAVGAVPQLANPDVDELVTPGDHRQVAAAITRRLRRSGEQGRTATCTVGGWDDMAGQLVELLDAARRSRSVASAPAVRSAPLISRKHLRLNLRRSWRAS
jgi:teichuronic acid biosynthesis glycosyltransferase TuaC